MEGNQAAAAAAALLLHLSVWQTMSRPKAGYAIHPLLHIAMSYGHLRDAGAYRISISKMRRMICVFLLTAGPPQGANSSTNVPHTVIGNLTINWKHLPCRAQADRQAEKSGFLRYSIIWSHFASALRFAAEIGLGERERNSCHRSAKYTN